MSRIRSVWDRFGQSFARRILMPAELEALKASNRPVAFLAKRFAAKEAFAKACGSGFRAGGIWLTDIGVTHNALGKPELIFSIQAQKIIQELGAVQSHVTLSDEQEFAVAFVILIGT